MFQRKMLAAKIHRVTVTDADVNYVGSITIDKTLLEACGMIPLEEVDVWNVTNGERFSTYVLPGEAGSGVVCVNGSAARRVVRGDLLIVAAFHYLSGDGLARHEARVVVPDAHNAVRERFVYRVDADSGRFESVPL